MKKQITAETKYNIVPLIQFIETVFGAETAYMHLDILLFEYAYCNLLKGEKQGIETGVSDTLFFYQAA